MKKNLKISSSIIFILIAIFYAVINFIWWNLNTPIFTQNLADSEHFQDIFLKNVFLFHNAPLITWIMKGMFSIFSKTYFDLQIIFVNYIFFLITLFFIYRLGIELKDKETGNIAMILFALTPIVYIMSRHYGHQDWHVMCAMVVNIYCLIKCNNFTDRKWSIFYGVSVGLGLLIKDEFLAYFFTPWLYIVIRSLLEKPETKKLSNIIITILIGSLIAGCHYFRILITYKILLDPISEPVHNSIFAFKNIRVLTTGISEYLLSPPIFIIFILGLIWFILKYKNTKKYIIILWFVVPWLIILLMPHYKIVEYEFPLIPAIILLSCVYISSFKNLLIKKIILITCISVCLFQFIIFSFYPNLKIYNTNFYKLYYYTNEYITTNNNKNKLYIQNIYHFSLTKYLLYNFSGKSLFFFRLSNGKIKYNKLNIFLNLFSTEKIKFSRSIFKLKFTNEISDIIIYELPFDITKKNIFYSDNIYTNILTEHMKNNIDTEINNFVYKINTSYTKIDDFYLDKKKKHHIYILAKKGLFNEAENIIKYPYKLENTIPNSPFF